MHTAADDIRAYDAYCDSLSAAPCSCCGHPIDGYEPTARDANLAPAAGLCEQCHAADVSRAKRERADAIRDGRGDYLRDQQRGEL